MPIKSDFQSMMRGEASFESAVAVPPELATDAPLDTSAILEIREDRQDVDQELAALIEAEPEVAKPIVQSVGAVEAIAEGATSVDAVTADAYVPVSNASMEQFSRILEVDIPKLEQELNGQVSLESLDSVRGWVTQAAQSFRSSVKNFFARIALWWRRQFVSCEKMRKRLNSIRARMSSRKGQGGKEIKLGKYAFMLVQGDGFAADPVAAMNAEGALGVKLSNILLAAQGGVAETLTSRLDQLLATDRPASAMFRQDLSKIIADLEAALKSQPPHLLGNVNIVTNQDEDFILLDYRSGTPQAAMVAKNAGNPLSLSPEQVSSYLDSIDALMDTIVSTIRAVEKESARVCKIAETAVDRVASKYVTTRDMTTSSLDDEGRPVTVVEQETSSSIGRVMETEYEIVEVINGLSWSINLVLSRVLYSASGVLTLVEESVIQD